MGRLTSTAKKTLECGSGGQLLSALKSTNYSILDEMDPLWVAEIPSRIEMIDWR